MERFALKSFSAASLMRWAASLITPGRSPSPDQMLGLFGVLEGAEIKGVVSPYKNTRQLVTIDTISLNWGQLVGSIPSKANLVAEDGHADRSLRSGAAAADHGGRGQARDRPRSRCRLDEVVGRASRSRLRPSISAISPKLRPASRSPTCRAACSRPIRCRPWARRRRSRPARSSSPCATAASSISSWRSSRACRMSAATPHAAPSSR